MELSKNEQKILENCRGERYLLASSYLASLLGVPFLFIAIFLAFVAVAHFYFSALTACEVYRALALSCVACVGLAIREFHEVRRLIKKLANRIEELEKRK